MVKKFYLWLKFDEAQYRIQIAKNYLKRNKYKVKEISEMVGLTAQSIVYTNSKNIPA